ncbi:peptidase inhibitor family I36 protein [Streptomyces sp. NPDC058964]|uniref:peptidase inhibitor family I36 protein n=1 Tax=Streptomyces sp. NPDC058964 TaxID=3346681 RepID=UPI0036AD9FEB
MRKRLFALAGVAVAAALPLTAQPASASSVCASGAVCTWPKAHFGGTKLTHHNPDPGCYAWGGRTISNQRSVRITVYSGGSCTGSHFDIKPKHYSDNVPFKVMGIGVWGR